MRNVTRLYGLERDLQTVQDTLATGLDEVRALPWNDGLLLSGVALVTGSDNKVAHKLGRQLLGYEVVRRSASATVWDTAADDKFLTLRASANVTVTLKVF